jgi:hypothetical protein
MTTAMCKEFTHTQAPRRGGLGVEIWKPNWKGYQKNMSIWKGMDFMDEKNGSHPWRHVLNW